ncbi:MAG: tripartite tricarboxylate transporter TctB family protein, partial [Alphaproteobacteria bacterium]|nr:tripartite tricarboxylate transporter TctB family protein [Alphaproteobacteria bacterium]
FGVVATFATCIYLSSGWDFGARLVPHVIAYAGILFTGGLIFSDLFVVPPSKFAVAEGEGTAAAVEEARGTTAGDAFKAEQEEVHFDIQADYGDLGVRDIFIRAARYFGWLVAFFVAASVVGLLPSMFLFLVGYMRFEGKESWRLTLYIAVPMCIFSYLLFHTLLLVQWPQTVIGDIFPEVRSIEWLNLF